MQCLKESVSPHLPPESRRLLFQWQRYNNRLLSCLSSVCLVSVMFFSVYLRNLLVIQSTLFHRSHREVRLHGKLAQIRKLIIEADQPFGCRPIGQIVRIKAEAQGILKYLLQCRHILQNCNTALQLLQSPRFNIILKIDQGCQDIVQRAYQKEKSIVVLILQ